MIPSSLTAASSCATEGGSHTVDSFTPLKIIVCCFASEIFTNESVNARKDVLEVFTHDFDLEYLPLYFSCSLTCILLNYFLAC